VLIAGMDVPFLKPIERRTLTGINLPPPPPQPRTVPNATSDGVPGKLYEPENATSVEPVPDAMSWLVPERSDGERREAERSDEILQGSSSGSCACCDCGWIPPGPNWVRYEPGDPYPIELGTGAASGAAQLPSTPAVPTNDPGTWIAPDELRLDERYGGDWLSYSLTVNRYGRVLECAIVRPSHSSAIDTAVCKLISRRARFEPATDRGGVAVEGAYNGTVRWEFAD
jgi:hypothetical protein